MLLRGGDCFDTISSIEKLLDAHENNWEVIRKGHDYFVTSLRVKRPSERPKKSIAIAFNKRRCFEIRVLTKYQVSAHHTTTLKGRYVV